ncbi:hypothetical protein BDZ97DRAFT_1662073 [Flammula alnicola]|nr:hypothetical protein BDZ97DRAFT_1662073 [Flammula alnicola]
MSAPAVVSRFHAIVTAKPLDSTGPPVLPPEPVYRPNPYEPWGVRFQNGKRTRDSNADAGPSTVKKATKRMSEDEGASSREPTTLYRDRDELLVALRDRFRQGPNVDFHGMYEILDPGITHKQRIQTVAHEIWKITGYRFTVKDHPTFTNGHKTRFWCSQDDAHRSKSSRAARKAQGSCYKPRVTSAGEVMAKTRYPCRSRLLISSRDSNLPDTRAITVRMHHHVAHEPYVDANLPPEVVQRIWEGFGWIESQGPVASTSGTSGCMDQGPSDVGMEEEEDSSEEEGSPADGYDAMDDDAREDPVPSFTDNDTPSPLIDKYHARMKAHIQNLREFCEGLEYQLQFNDYRMLDVLEQEGGSFLNLVAECLKKEGRLATTDLSATSQPGNGQILNSPSADITLASIDPSRTYEGNPGINPRALDY